MISLAMGYSSPLALKKLKEYRFRIARVNLSGPETAK